MKKKINMISPEQNFSPEAFPKPGERDKKILSDLGLSREEIDGLENPDTSGSTALISFIDRGDRKIVVKKGIDVDPDLNARREYTFLRLLRMRSGDKIAPDPYFYTASPEGDLLIMERIEGQMIDEISDNDLSKIAQTMAKVHKPEFKKPGIPFCDRVEASQYDRLIEQVDFLRNWFDELSSYINDVNINQELDLKQLSEAKDIILDIAVKANEAFKDHSFSLIHYDLDSGNILKDNEGKILFLDWRQASIGDRAMDIAKFFYKNGLNSQQQEAFLDVYLSEVNDDTVRDRINVYNPLIRLGSLLWRLRFLNIDINDHPEVARRVDVKLVRARLNSDYQYLISKAGINTNE